MGSTIGLKEPQKRFRILALDGGGVKGTYTAAFLHTLESLTEKKCSDHFDLIAGTSTGGIIAIAIGLGIPLEVVLDLYVNKGPEIFRKPSRNLRGRLASTWGWLWTPKHSQAVLRQCLNEIIGGRRFGESANRLVIPSFNAVNGNIQLFKTAHDPAYRMDYRLRASEVALATSAAPTFFSAYHDGRGGVYLDGGVWANCPAVVALTEATAKLNWPIESIDVLSIGTTRAPFDVRHKQRRAGLFGWNVGVIELFQQAQDSGMLGIATAMCRENLIRIDEVARPGRFSLDNADEASDLQALGENSARQNASNICERFFSEKSEPFLPCYSSDVSTLPKTA